jgi:hypothetical protein
MNVLVKGESIELFDERFYSFVNEKGEEIFYPSVTTVLANYPVGYGYINWLKDVGHSAEIIAARAAEAGQVVHNACAELMKGKTINYRSFIYALELKYHGNAFTLEEWRGVLKFVDFWRGFQPEYLGTDFSVYSHAHQFAGTVDLYVKIKDEHWLIDIKFTNSIWAEHYLQVAAYATAMREAGFPVDRIGLLHLKAATRGRDKSGAKMQGAGWCLVEPSKSIEHYFDVFSHLLGMYRFENPEPKPKSESLPLEVCLVDTLPFETKNPDTNGESNA